MQQIAIMKTNDRTTLYVDFVHLMAFDTDLCEAVQDEYYRIEPYLCDGLKQVIANLYPDYLYMDQVEKKENVFWVAFYNVPAMQKLRDLTANKIGKLLTISGTVTRTSEVRPELLKAKFVCRHCQTTSPYVQQQFCFTEPTSCSNPKCDKAPNWELETGSSIFTDWQKVRMQEASADIPSGSMPRSLDVILRNEAVDKCKAGDSTVFCGTLIVIPDVSQFNLPGVKAQGKKAGSGAEGTRGLKQTGVRDLTYRLCFLASTVRLSSLRSGSINLMEDQEDNVVEELTDVEKRDIYQMSQGDEIYGDLARSLAPTIFGHDEIKRGLLLMLLGGVHKETMEGINLRGDINICIVGDPSTSKSQFLKYVVKFMPRAVYTSGKASSAAGLTATVAKDHETGEFNIEAGALMLADNGICCKKFFFVFSFFVDFPVLFRY
jgi:DNA replication licensing factor MCM6